MSESPTATVEWLVQRGKAAVGRVVVRYDGAAFEVVAPGSIDAPDVTLTLAPTDAAAVRAEALRPSVAFMRGQMKMTGDFGALLHVLPVAETPAHRASLAVALAAAVPS